MTVLKHLSSTVLMMASSVIPGPLDHLAEAMLVPHETLELQVQSAVNQALLEQVALQDQRVDFLIKDLVVQMDSQVYQHNQVKVD